MIKAGMLLLLAHIAWRFRRPCARATRPYNPLGGGGRFPPDLALLAAHMETALRGRLAGILPDRPNQSRRGQTNQLDALCPGHLCDLGSRLRPRSRGSLMGRSFSTALAPPRGRFCCSLAVSLGCHARQVAAATRRAWQPNFVRPQRQKHVATSYELNRGMTLRSGAGVLEG